VGLTVKLPKHVTLVVAAGFSLQLSACQTNPNELAMKVGAPPVGAVELRSLQTRRFDTTNRVVVLSAATQTLQDLGFTIQESASQVGVVSASKKRDATETGQVAGAVALAVIGAAFGVYVDPTWDEDQQINVTVVEAPVSDKQVDVRVSFDRTLRNNKNMYRAEHIIEPKIYQEFFDKFSQSMLLEKSQ
jgi:hypothetical protein